MSRMNPTDRIDLDFHTWLNRRERRLASHHQGGVPDYAFSLDWSLRQRLDSITPLRLLAEALNSGTVPVQRAMNQMSGVVVGPEQFPQVHAMGVACAERLGIGVPQLFVTQDPSPNAFTFATGHVDQIIVLTSGLLQTLNKAELFTVIGHECGHIHNRHVVYNTLWELLTNVVARKLLIAALSMMGPAGWLMSLVDALFQLGTTYVFGRWHRCAEITCDRAGLICAGDYAASLSLMGRIHMGAVGQIEGFNPDAYKRQTSNWEASLLRFQELFMSHPPGPKRTAAIESFASCEVLKAWRPEFVLRGPPLTRNALDREIEANLR
jgi:Zn-dependent protease with chaperone function